MLGQLAGSLPAPRTSLIGREQDAAEVGKLVLHSQERLVTLTGAGGSGKTRLAYLVASDLREAFPDGVWLVELAPLSDPLLLPEAVATALGIEFGPDRRTSEALLDSLRQRSLLLVLDNCEHLIEACAELADALLSACPGVRILATSREALQIAGERQRRVHPLPVPDAIQLAPLEELGHCPSVQLFVERAGAVEPGFRLTAENAPVIARICTLLGGLPLALELAAARVRVLSLGQIEERLDDCLRLLVGSSRSAPTRQQTLRATLDWSYKLLREPEQAALRRLAVFPGGWGLEGAEAICRGEETEGVEVLEVLTGLVDKSLVLVEEQDGEARYRLLEPVRQYAMRLLAESGEVEASRARLAGYCIALAERAEPALFGPEQVAWLRRIDREFDNVRAVLRWAEESGDAETPLRLCGALRWYFWLRRHLREGLRWLDAALARSESGVVQPKVRAKGLAGVTLACSFLGEYSKGLALGREAAAIYREVGDGEGLAWCDITLSHINLDRGDLASARSLGEEGLALARASGQHSLLGHALTVLAEVVRRQGEGEQAIALYEEALATFQEHGDRFGIGLVEYALAAAKQGTTDFKLPAAAATVQLYWERGDHLALADALEYLAGRGEPGRAETSVRLYAAAQSLRKALGSLPPPVEREDVERRLAAARAELGEARFTAAWAEGCALSLEQVVASVLGGGRSAPESEPAAPSHRAPGPSDALTRREREVARLIALGCTDRQIAERLTITEGTAGVHVHHILEKLGLRSRVQVADWALAQGLIDVPPE